MADMRMGRNTVKQIKKTWDKKERERKCVCERERAGKRWPWFLSRKEKPCRGDLQFSSSRSVRLFSLGFWDIFLVFGTSSWFLGHLLRIERWDIFSVLRVV